ncbi:MAG: hypothetical protein WBM44_25660 [Waterburya sp.]
MCDRTTELELAHELNNLAAKILRSLKDILPATLELLNLVDHEDAILDLLENYSKLILTTV